MKKAGKRIGYVLIFLFLVSLIAVCPLMAGYQEINEKLGTDKFVQKANSFLVLFDRSGSMNGAKFELEKKLVAAFSNTLPTLRLTAGLRDFGENYFNFDKTGLQYGISSYDREKYNEVIAGIKTPFGNTPLELAISIAGKDLKRAPGKIALVVFSDGEDQGEAPVKAANEVKAAYGDRLCIYTVQIGSSPAGAKLLERIAQAGKCGFFVNGSTLVSDAGMTAFVERIFLAPKPAEVAAPAPPPAPEPPVVQQKRPAPEAKAEVKPAPAPAPPKKVTISLDVKFQTNKSVLQPIYWWEVQKLADFMKKYPETDVTIEGHTDSVGKEAANMKLSQARADAIAKLLTDKYGIDKSRVKAIGYGPKKPIADNKTEEGRAQNRRVEAQIETMTR